MTKFGRRLRFGYCPLPAAADPMRPLHLARRAEALELDYVAVQDYPDNAAHHETWTLLTAVGVTTSRIGIFPILAELPLRNPLMLAKAAASLDLLTGGRVEIGLDARASALPLSSVDGDKRSNDAAQTRLEESIQVMRRLWSSERSVRFAGRFYQLADLRPGPAPAHHIGIWLAGNAPETLALAGRLADGWIADPYPDVQPDDLEKLSKQIDDAAESAGRSPSEIQRIWRISGTIGSEKDRSPFKGSAKEWAESLLALATQAGIDTFLLMEGENAEDQLERFAQEVMPHTCELMEQATGVSQASGLARASQGAEASGATPAEEETDDVDLVDETSMESFPASDPPSTSSTS